MPLPSLLFLTKPVLFALYTSYTFLYLVSYLTSYAFILLSKFLDQSFKLPSIASSLSSFLFSLDKHATNHKNELAQTISPISVL